MAPLPPRATYRLQFNKNFTFQHATAIIPYLKNLGISHIYSSPLLKARQGSMHGYDIVDFGLINPEIGTIEELAQLAETLQAHQMGLILDIVPNHICINDPGNKWWADVLEKGQESAYADYFDIDWNSAEPVLKGKVLLPLLEEQPNELIDRGEIYIDKDKGHFCLHTPYHILPLNKASQALLDKSQNRLRDPNLVKQVLENQFYRLSHWKEAAEKLNYRRFFDVNDLAGIRVEMERVFNDVHRLILNFVSRGWVSGLRLDHVDGLYDPENYFIRLRQACRDASPQTDLFYIVAEKILTGDEKLPVSWPVQGTTGYESMNLLNGIFVPCQMQDRFTAVYRAFSEQKKSPQEVILQSKRLILQESMPTEVRRLARALYSVSQTCPLDSLYKGLQEVIACFPVYRTYIRPPGEMSETDRRIMVAAVREAKKNSSDVDDAVFNLIESALLLELPENTCDFVMRFQQTTGPVMAKGVEDTALYRYYPLCSLNDVGSELERFGVSSEKLHASAAEKNRLWPYGLTATSTHDTKRSEDVRARINVLSEMPVDWESALARWNKLNKGFKTQLDGKEAPDSNEEYLIYQTLIGTWEKNAPAYSERIVRYMQKALKEAKQNTSWTAPNTAHEEAVETFIRKILSCDAFLNDFVKFIQPVQVCGLQNTLSQTVLKICFPGVPDFYQGSELWDDSLVDPDNRRPVDYSLRQEILDRLDESEHSKLFVTAKALEFRKAHARLFTDGTYEPVLPSGEKAEHLIGCKRELSDQCIIVLAARFFFSLDAWGETWIRVSPGRYRDALTQNTVEAPEGKLFPGEVFSSFSQALLEKQ